MQPAILPLEREQPAQPGPDGCAAQYLGVRAQTEALCAALAIEDYVPQSMPDASPVKWHLAHTSWFFERFLLQAASPAYRCFDPAFDYLFNSYYHGAGPQWSRSSRGLLSRPTVDEVYRYRRHVDERLLSLLRDWDRASLEPLLHIGIHHEQQHQELLLTDLKHLLSLNPLRPAYRAALIPSSAAPAGRLGLPGAADTPAPLRWLRQESGLVEIGCDARAGFCFDNETPRHRRYIGAFATADRLITNLEFGEFVRDGGYRNPALWLSDGWPLAQSWERPLYWSESLQSEFTLSGEQALAPASPVCHLSYYEADAFARWAGVRLPTEEEWERVAAGQPLAGSFLEGGGLHPRAASGGDRQFFGELWQWTASAYLPYPGFRPWAGVLGEYNGKFMANQFVLRGGSCATPRSHMRATYRNFFPPQSRWQFAGLRLAKDS